MSELDFNRVFDAMRDVRVAVLGDFCIDHYLLIDPHWRETSVETGLPIRGVASQRYSPGGAGNVAANLAALGVGEVHCVGCIGDDPYGICMVESLKKLGCDPAGLVLQEEGFSTRAYVKPYVEGVEESRLDHGVANRVSAETTAAVAAHLKRMLSELDAVVLNQQVREGVWSDALFEVVGRLAAEFPGVTWVVDSRDCPERFHGMIVKLNDNEAARLHGRDVRPGEQVTEDETAAALDHLHERFGSPVVITRGANGAVAKDASGVYEVPGVHTIGEIDTVGAGDTFVSALAGSLGAGLGLEEAVTFANLAASVTVRKLRQTGTASEAEIREIGTDVDYVYYPELAANPRRARYLDGLDVEIIRPRDLGDVRFALFDHDGTISTLREGWEHVMEPMMVRAILGAKPEEVDDRVYARAVSAARAFIDQSTGVATLRQMQGLVRMVREFGIVPESDILDIHGYKAVYNEALMGVVADRVARLERGERDACDFIIKGAVECLQALRERGVSLVLASGTDEADVRREAEALGYAGLFEGRIYGATGDVEHCSKLMVIERTLAGLGDSGEALLVCGDGPVELREARKRGGIALGVASDEPRRHGWNMAKRSRLIRAGADYLVPDWSQHERLLGELFG